jgi:peptide-methionine (S)-S-oxide reductase
LHKPVFDQKSVKGGQYRSSIFFETKEEEAIARSVKARFEQEEQQKLFTEIVPGREFHPAEEYHQDYYKKNNLLYGGV